MTRILDALRRLLRRLRLPPDEWRVIQDDGLWYVETAHPEYGWMRHHTGHARLVDAAQEGRASYDRAA